MASKLRDNRPINDMYRPQQYLQTSAMVDTHQLGKMGANSQKTKPINDLMNYPPQQNYVTKQPLNTSNNFPMNAVRLSNGGMPDMNYQRHIDMLQQQQQHQQRQYNGMQQMPPGKHFTDMNKPNTMQQPLPNQFYSPYDLNKSTQGNQMQQQQQQLQQQVPRPAIKKVSFEAGTKTANDVTHPTPIIQNMNDPMRMNLQSTNCDTNMQLKQSDDSTGLRVTTMPTKAYNTNGNQIQKTSTKCNLCRKKFIVPPSIYCYDCDFYMSRFQTKTQ